MGSRQPACFRAAPCPGSCCTAFRTVSLLYAYGSIPAQTSTKPGHHTLSAYAATFAALVLGVGCWGRPSWVYLAEMRVCDVLEF